MKLLYICSHQIHNLTPLFRELSKKNEIDFKAVYWQKISEDQHDFEFEKNINFGIDLFSGHNYECLFEKEKKQYDLSLFFKLKVLFKLIKFIFNEEFDAIVFHGYLFPHVLAAILAKIKGKKTIIRSISYDLGKIPPFFCTRRSNNMKFLSDFS